MSEGNLYGVKDIGFEQQYRASKTRLYSAWVSTQNGTSAMS